MKLNYQLPSRLDQIYPAEEEILAEAGKRGFDEGGLFAIRLAFDEACINAIKHGNKNNPAKSLWVEAQFENGVITIKIKDEGHGFNPHRLPDPRTAQNLRQPTGRGVFLIKRFSHQVTYNEVGNEITFTILADQKSHA